MNDKLLCGKHGGVLGCSQKAAIIWIGCEHNSTAVSLGDCRVITPHEDQRRKRSQAGNIRKKIITPYLYLLKPGQWLFCRNTSPSLVDQPRLREVRGQIEAYLMISADGDHKLPFFEPKRGIAVC